MTRSSLLLAGATLLCGALLGWGGAMMVGYWRPIPETSTDSAIESGSVVQTHRTDTLQEIHIAPEVPPEISFPLEASAPRPASAMVVGVHGAVRRPGVYHFEADARVQDGIRAAGGVAENADMDDINVAARLMDNTSLYIPFQVFRYQEQQALVARRTPAAAETNPARYTRSGWAQATPGVISQNGAASTAPAPVASPSAAAVPAASALINLNHATFEELQQLPGVGPKTAEKIIAYRQAQPFRTVEELDAVHGIGEKRMEALRGLVTVE